MRNQPKYHFIKNTIYALKGLFDIIKNETSFKLELFITIILIPIIIFIDTSLTNKLFMFITLMGILIAEVINSAVERVVDLVTLEHHELAGKAKDAGSAIVFLSICICVITWLSIFFSIFL